MKQGMVYSLVLVLASVGVGSVGQLMLKMGMIQVGWVGRVEMSRPLETMGRVLTNPLILGAVPLYIFGFMLWLVVLSRLQLSFAYPLLALVYLVNPLLARLVLGESIPEQRWVGILVICAGVAIVSRTGG